MQEWPDIPETDTLVESRPDILTRDRTVKSNHSGTSFPTQDLEVGMTCYRTDQRKLFLLLDLAPNWKLIADLNKTYVASEDIGTTFQPRSSILDAMSAVTGSGLVQRDTSGSFLTLAVTAVAVSFLTAASAASMRSVLGLGTAATKNEGAGSTLDADKLDGQEGAFYLNPANLSTVVPNAKLPSNAHGSRTVSTGTPTGGADGDIWLQV